MTKVAISVLVVVVIVTGGLLARASGNSTELQNRIAALESERAALQAKLEAAEGRAASLQARLTPFERKQASSLRFSEELVVPPGATQSYSFTPMSVPGTLTGTWRSSGAGFGGQDDTISGFRLTDPKDSILERTAVGSVSSGRFLVKISERGAYTFFFDSKGPLRNTSRRVFLEAEFRPD